MDFDVDDRFVDVDFSKEPEFVFGLIDPSAFEVFSAYEAAVPILEWNEIDDAIDRMDEQDDGLEWMVDRIFDQGREGSCVANACAQAHQICQAKQFGIENVIDLSAISLYKQIGRSASSGAMVSDGLEVMCSKGILPLDTPKNRELFGNAVMPNTGFNTRYPSDWLLTAVRLAGYEYHRCTTLRGLYTAGVNRDPIIVGREGHSICYARPIRKGSNRGFKGPNSWSLKWGIAAGNMPSGFFVDSQSQTEKSAKSCYVLRQVRKPILEAA